MKITDLKDKHKNSECVVLTCGPSLNEYSREKVRDFCKGKIVICVKEAVIEFADICDYHIVNGTRMRSYNIPDTVTTIFQSNNREIKSNYDIIVYEHRNFCINNQLLRLKNFEAYNFDNNLERPWGPGILYETVFYLCLYMGIKCVYPIGWDLIDTNSKINITHYFDDYNDADYKSSQRWAKNHNFKSEMKFVNDNIEYMYEHLKNKGMDLVVIGETSFVNDKIPRKILD